MAWWKEYKSKLCCQECGEDHPACIQFHHPDPSVKEGNISEMVHHGSKMKLLKEVEKCIPLCANCHSKIHYS